MLTQWQPECRDKHVPNERTRENSRKGTKWNEAKQSTTYRVLKKTKPVIRMLNELRGRIDELKENFNKKVVNIKNDTETIKRTSQK